MGREMWTVIKDVNGATVWDSTKDEDTFFCGRSRATNTIARNFYVNPDEVVEEEGEGEMFDFTDTDTRNRLLADLQDVADEDTEDYDYFINTLEDLKIARRNARTLDDFDAFTDRINTMTRENKDVYWSEAEDMQKLMDRTMHKAAELAHCELWFKGAPTTLGGFRMYWVLSE